MLRRFGLTRDPFQPVYDAELYWESRTRREQRRQAAQLLVEGAGIWIQGPPGSGRTAFAKHLFGELGDNGQPVIAAAGPTPETGPELVALLASHLCVEPLPAGGGDPLAPVEQLYAALVDIWLGVGALPLLIGEGRVGPRALEELGLLCGLRLFRQPLVCVALVGEGPPPPGWKALEVVELAPLSGEELGRMLRHRLLLCGAPDALGRVEVDALCDRPSGVAATLEAAHATLVRRSLSLPQPQPLPQPQRGSQPGASPEASEPALFSREEIGAVSDLLHAISSEPDPSKD